MVRQGTVYAILSSLMAVLELYQTKICFFLPTRQLEATSHSFLLFLSQKTIIKKLTKNEDEIYESLQTEQNLVEFIAGYHGVGIVDKKPYIRLGLGRPQISSLDYQIDTHPSLDNLLYKKSRAQVLDIKIGTRSFYESTDSTERKLSYVSYLADLDPSYSKVYDKYLA